MSSWAVKFIATSEREISPSQTQYLGLPLATTQPVTSPQLNRPASSMILHTSPTQGWVSKYLSGESPTYFTAPNPTHFNQASQKCSTIEQNFSLEESVKHGQLGGDNWGRFEFKFIGENVYIWYDTLGPYQRESYPPTPQASQQFSVLWMIITNCPENPQEMSVQKLGKFCSDFSLTLFMLRSYQCETNRDITVPWGQLNWNKFRDCWRTFDMTPPGLIRDRCF